MKSLAGKSTGRFPAHYPVTFWVAITTLSAVTKGGTFASVIKVLPTTFVSNFNFNFIVSGMTIGRLAKVGHTVCVHLSDRVMSTATTVATVIIDFDDRLTLLATTIRAILIVTTFIIEIRKTTTAR